MDQNNIKKELVFSEPAGQVLSDILKKYKLEEPADEVFKKIEIDQPMFAEIITDATRNLFRGSIKETELSPLLKDKLNIPKESAEALAVDIKVQLLPLLKEVTTTPEEKMEQPPQIENDNPMSFVKTAPTVSVEENEKILKINRESAKNSAANKEPITPSGIKKTKTVQTNNVEKPVSQPIRPKGPDSYREPIE